MGHLCLGLSAQSQQHLQHLLHLLHLLKAVTATCSGPSACPLPQVHSGIHRNLIRKSPHDSKQRFLWLKKGHYERSKQTNKRKQTHTSHHPAALFPGRTPNLPTWALLVAGARRVDWFPSGLEQTQESRLLPLPLLSLSPLLRPALFGSDTKTITFNLSPREWGGRARGKWGQNCLCWGLGLKGGVTGKAGELLLEGFLDTGNFTLVL